MQEENTQERRLTAPVPPRAAIYISRGVLLSALWRMNLRNAVVCGFIKAAFATLSLRQLQYILPSSRQRYERFVRRQKKEFADGSLGITSVPKIEPLDRSGGALLWLGNRQKATKVVYFLHGGGFFVPLARGHLRWCWDLYIKSSAAAGIDVACAILEYRLAPESVYPNHLRQASLGLQAIFDQGFSPEDIIVGGDSAGGNLTMQLLMHIKHPHPEVAPVNIEGPLAAAFLVSAYLTHRTTELASFQKYLNVDLSPGKSRVLYIQSQVGATSNPIPEMESKYWWGSPLNATASKWKGLDRVVRHAYITYGEYEVLADHSEEMIRLLKTYSPGMDLVIELGHREVHDTVVLEEMTHEHYGPGSMRLQRWFSRYIDGYYESTKNAEKPSPLRESHAEITSA